MFFSAHDNENKYGKITKISFGVRGGERQGVSDWERSRAERFEVLQIKMQTHLEPRTERNKKKKLKKQKKQKKNNSSFRAIIENQGFEEQKVWRERERGSNTHITN